ncbi:MAG: DUF6340 family protein [Flavobacteriales bacterium]|nr:DUF6340 family protein [Flavobacteriales bacterium]
MLLITTVINRAAGDENTAAIYVEGVPVNFIPGLPEMAARKTINSLEYEVENLERFRFVAIDWDNSERDDKDFAAPAFSAEEIDSLCAAYEVDGLLSIDGLELVIRTNGEVNVVSVSDEAGRMIQVPEFTQRQEISMTPLWRFYDGLSLQVIDEYQKTYQGVFNESTLNPNEQGDVNLSEGSLIDISVIAAHDYHNRISPHWEPGQRLYYRGNTNELLSISSDLEYTGDWEAAAKEWMKLTTANDDKVRYFATYNMAVASEMLGRPKTAKTWLQKAREIDDKKQVSRYMEIIDQQILIYDVVDRQLGVQ